MEAVSSIMLLMLLPLLFSTSSWLGLACFLLGLDLTLGLKDESAEVGDLEVESANKGKLEAVEAVEDSLELTLSGLI
jgi:hypothetical protein